MRTLRNLRKIGIREYLHQMQYMGDTKAGTYIASDRAGNKYYENLDDELPCMSQLFCSYHWGFVISNNVTVRTRWVDYKEKEYDPYDLFYLSYRLSRGDVDSTCVL